MGESKRGFAQSLMVEFERANALSNKNSSPFPLLRGRVIKGDGIGKYKNPATGNREDD